MRRVTDPHGFTWSIDFAGRLTAAPPDPAPDGEDGAAASGDGAAPALPPAIWVRISAPGLRERIVTAPAPALDALSDSELLELVEKALDTDGPTPGGEC
ncbi:MAG TPA: hypothetical protein VFS05_12560 [Gemmatimonadaceae bacterium]|nr:hypothetical protein [Gemmatimonadaceae bacterium]